jgi:hypothetical protein
MDEKSYKTRRDCVWENNEVILRGENVQKLVCRFLLC